MNLLKNKKIVFIIITSVVIAIVSYFHFNSYKKEIKNIQKHQKIIVPYFKLFMKNYEIDLNTKFPQSIKTPIDIPFMKNLWEIAKTDTENILQYKKDIVNKNLCILKDFKDEKSIKKFLNYFNLYNYIYKSNFYYNGKLPFLNNGIEYTGLVFWNLNDLSYSKINNGYYSGLTVMCSTLGYPLKIDNYYLFNNKIKYFARGIFDFNSFRLKNLEISYNNYQYGISFYKNVVFNLNNDNRSIKNIVIHAKTKYDKNLININIYKYGGTFYKIDYKYKNIHIKYKITPDFNGLEFYIYIKNKNGMVKKGIKYIYKLNNNGIYVLQSKIKINGGFYMD